LQPAFGGIDNDFAFAGLGINAQAAATGDAIVAFARQYLKYPYVSGEGKPLNGLRLLGLH
jgi:hypothetical protein